MDKKQQIQEDEYSFPYHHIPKNKNGKFTQIEHLYWGYVYLSYIEAVLEKIESLPHASILDIGTGDGRLPSEARKRFPSSEIWANDYSPKAIAQAHAFNFKNNVHLSTENVVNISKEHGPFDIVTAIEVLEHIPKAETNEFAKNLASALSKNGTGIITVPSNNLSLNKKHYQHFNKELMTKTLEPHLKIKDIFYLNSINWKSWLIGKLFGNRFFLLNHSGLSNFLYKNYKKHCLYTSPDKCGRLMVLVKKA